VNLKGKTTTLDQSYRIPKQVQNLALDVIKRVKERRTKEWSPREAEGSLEYRPTTDGIDFSAGEWLILARNNYLLEAVEEQCRREGWIFEKNGRRSVSDKTLNTIRGWEALRKGELVSHSVARDILRVIPRKSKWFPKDGQYSLQNLKEDYGVNTKSIWHEAFEKMSLVERSYLVAALRRGEKVSKRPRISMNTIHSVKGGQADNVVLFSDIAQRTYRALLNFPEDEHRVFYVGITRAKEKLIVILPNSKFFFAGL
jgi:superfamily I DNA/RNA helicase